MAHDLEPFSPVDESAGYPGGGQRYRRQEPRRIGPTVINDLAERGALFHQGTVTHRYGHCWRCHKPII